MRKEQQTYSGEESIIGGRSVPTCRNPYRNIEARSILFRLPLFLHRRGGVQLGNFTYWTWPGCSLCIKRSFFSSKFNNHGVHGYVELPVSKSIFLLHDWWDFFVGKPLTKKMRSKQDSALWHYFTNREQPQVTMGSHLRTNFKRYSNPGSCPWIHL